MIDFRGVTRNPLGPYWSTEAKARPGALRVPRTDYVSVHRPGGTYWV